MRLTLILLIAYKFAHFIAFTKLNIHGFSHAYLIMKFKLSVCYSQADS